MRRPMRDQRSLLEAMAVKIERERKGHGGHVVRYCQAATGDRFQIILQSSRLGPRALENLALRVRKFTDGGLK